MRLSLGGDQDNNPAVDHLVGGRLRLLRHRPHVRRAVRDPGSALLTGRQGGSINELEDPPETVFKDKHGVWDPMPELAITSPYADSRVNYNIFTMGNPIRDSTLHLYQTLL
jgi:hypothetical protein